MNGSIVFLGCGFVGGWTARITLQRLRTANSTRKIIFIDDGEFEARNLPTQYLSPRETGNSKAYVTSEIADAFLFDNEAQNNRFTLGNSRQLLKPDTGLIIDCFDNVPSRQDAYWAAKVLKCDCLHIGLSLDGFGTVEWNENWALNPLASLIPEIAEGEVKLPPCELDAYLTLGIMTSLKASDEILRWEGGSSLSNWLVTRDWTKRS